MLDKLRAVLGLDKSPRWCIEVRDGTTMTARILYEGKSLRGISRAVLDIEAGQPPKLTLEVHPINLQAVLDRMSIQITTDPSD